MLYFEVVLLILPKYCVFFDAEVDIELVTPIEKASLDVLPVNWRWRRVGAGRG
jgi:hypothetical protein